MDAIERYSLSVSETVRKNCRAGPFRARMSKASDSPLNKVLLFIAWVGRASHASRETGREKEIKCGDFRKLVGPRLASD